MKFRIGFKTPDALDCINDEVSDHCAAHFEHDRSCDACEEEKLNKKYKVQAIKDKLGKFVSYGECITVEFDTDNDTATVIPARR